MRVYTQIMAYASLRSNITQTGFCRQFLTTIPMQNHRIALVTGANQGVGLQVATELVANGLTVLVGSRSFERGQAAAASIGIGSKIATRNALLQRRIWNHPALSARPPALLNSSASSTNT